MVNDGPVQRPGLVAQYLCGSGAVVGARDGGRLLVCLLCPWIRPQADRIAVADAPIVLNVALGTSNAGILSHIAHGYVSIRALFLSVGSLSPRRRRRYEAVLLQLSPIVRIHPSLHVILNGTRLHNELLAV